MMGKRHQERIERQMASIAELKTAEAQSLGCGNARPSDTDRPWAQTST